MSYHILVTNDDGIHSPALRAVEVALSKLGRVTVVAPSRERSATSHCITLDETVTYERIASNQYAVEGTPADCVIAALSRILDELPSIVVSGVNQGLNAGEDIMYSGTVAAASEAAIHGLPAIAISAAVRNEADYGTAAQVAAHLAARILTSGLPPDVILNVNCPMPWNQEFRLTRQGRRRSRIQHGNGPMTDIEAIAAGFVSISPLHINRSFPLEASSWLRDFAVQGGVASGQS